MIRRMTGMFGIVDEGIQRLKIDMAVGEVGWRGSNTMNANNERLYFLLKLSMHTADNLFQYFWSKR